jgi:DNA-binding transcriptional MerR regulator
MTSTPDLLKIGDFARFADTNLRTLRYYEELGLLAPASRSKGGFRYYRRGDIHRVQRIRELQELGLHLEQIRELLSARGDEEPREQYFARIRSALEAQRDLLEKRMNALEEQRKKVSQALHKLGECRHCTQSPGQENNFCQPCATTGERLPEHLSALYQ